MECCFIGTNGNVEPKRGGGGAGGGRKGKWKSGAVRKREKVEKLQERVGCGKNSLGRRGREPEKCPFFAGKGGRNGK